jgi:hypothetical protein
MISINDVKLAAGMVRHNQEKTLVACLLAPFMLTVILICLSFANLA